jgi:hypothetical protein
MTRSAYQSKLDPACNTVDAALADEFLRPSALINAHQQRGAENPRDHVYALVGITQDGSQDDATLVDYPLPVDLVYQKFAIHCFKADHSLRALWNCCGGKKPEQAYKVPSWTRDWTESSSTSSWSCSAFEASAIGGWNTVPFFSHEHNGEPCMKPHPKANGISVTGYEIDAVQAVSHTGVDKKSMLTLNAVIWQEWIRLVLRDWDLKAYAAEDKKSAFWRTLISNRTFSGDVKNERSGSPGQPQGAPAYLGEEFARWFRRKDLSSFEHALQETGTEYDENGFRLWLRRLLASLSSNTRLFATERG